MKYLRFVLLSKICILIVYLLLNNTQGLPQNYFNDNSIENRGNQSSGLEINNCSQGNLLQNCIFKESVGLNYTRKDKKYLDQLKENSNAIDIRVPRFIDFESYEANSFDEVIINFNLSIPVTAYKYQQVIFESEVLANIKINGDKGSYEEIYVFAELNKKIVEHSPKYFVDCKNANSKFLLDKSKKIEIFYF